jgi:hypothetical protein
MPANFENKTLRPRAKRKIIFVTTLYSALHAYTNAYTRAHLAYLRETPTQKMEIIMATRTELNEEPASVSSKEELKKLVARKNCWFKRCS